jgi:hypothetical protein
MRLVIKSALIILLLALLLIVSGLMLIQYSPQSVLSLSQHVSPYSVTVEQMEIDLSTPSIEMTGLQVSTTSEPVITLAALEAFAFSTSWQSLWENSQEWTGATKNGVIHLNKLAQSNTEGSSETSAPNIGGLHGMLQKANITAENIVVNLRDNSSATLDYLRRPEALQTEEQGLVFSLQYQQDATTLALQGTLLSRVNEGVPEITLSLPRVDLRKLMSAQDGSSNPSLAVANKAAIKTGIKTEARIDWSPLSQLTPLTLTFQSDNIQLPQGDINNIRSRITLSNTKGVQGIQQEHTANINLTLHNDITIKQAVNLSADWRTLGEKTSGADIHGNTTLSLGDNTINVTGKVNLNGMIEQDMIVTTTIQQLSGITALSKEAIQQQKALEQLLPFTGTAQLNLQENQLALNAVDINAKDSDIKGNVSITFDKSISDLRAMTFDINSTQLIIPQLSKKKTTENTPSNSLPLEWLSTIKADGNINIGTVVYNDETVLTSARTQVTLEDSQLLLNDLAISAKGSDINGKITVDINEKTTPLYAMTFDLNSTQVVLPHTKTTNKKTTNTSTSSEKTTLFNSGTLPTDWLTTVKAEGKITIANVMRNNELLAANADSHISLDKNKLQLSSSIGSIAGGKSNLDLSIDNTDNQLAISLNASAKNLILEKLALVPKEELSGGTSNIELSLTTYGLSTQALASHLQGDLLVTAKDGVIANNTFEAIGSDVLLKLLNTINPFYKSSKTTNLECAVVKSKIVDGKMLFDDSIAIKTSQMIITADGEIDLTKEQINLGINPKARKGVGVDIASLAKFVAVQGPLTKPTVGVSAKGTAKSLLSIGAAISTGGLSLLATKLADTVISGDPCEVAKNAFSKKPDSTPSHTASES